MSSLRSFFFGSIFIVPRLSFNVHCTTQRLKGAVSGFFQAILNQDGGAVAEAILGLDVKGALGQLYLNLAISWESARA